MSVGLGERVLIQPGRSARDHFPIFSEHQRMAYLDSAASTQKPRAVIDRLVHYLESEHANVHRGAYELSIKATQNYEKARAAVARFINAAAPENVIFTRGATEAVNLVAHGFAKYFQAGDGVLLTLLEHHSNIVPWQMLAERKRISLEFVRIGPDASLDMEDLRQKLSNSPKLVAITAVSNAFGTVIPLPEIICEAHKVGAKVLVDAAQAVAHMPIDVQGLDVDFLVFSGHKLYGPTGIGALYAKAELLDYMDPFQGGGDMIESVTVQGSTWAQPPQRFEAGTPAIAEAIALESAVDFLEYVGLERIHRYEEDLHARLLEVLVGEDAVKIYGPAQGGGQQASIVAFNIDGVHPHDFATVADSLGVQVRAGHHCAMPAHHALGLSASARASLGVYSTVDDIEALREAIRKARKILRS